MTLIPVPGGHIAAWSEGHGPLVVFLHGGPGDTHHYMKRMAEPFFSDFRCVFFDQRGTGGSKIDPRNQDQFRLELLLSDLAAVCDHFAGPKKSVRLVGHSWGAMYALYACIDQPTRFLRAALLNMGPLDSSIEKQTTENILQTLNPDEQAQWAHLRLLRNRARDEGDIANVLKHDRELMKLRLKSWIYNPAQRESFLQEYHSDPPPDREVNKWIWESQSDWFTWSSLQKIQTPLWICSGKSDATPIEQSQRIAAHVKESTLSIYDRCGHMPWVDVPDRFHSDCREFLLGAR